MEALGAIRFTWSLWPRKEESEINMITSPLTDELIFKQLEEIRALYDPYTGGPNESGSILIELRARHRAKLLAHASIIESRMHLLERAYWIATGLNPAQDLGPDAMGPPLTDEEIITQASLTSKLVQEAVTFAHFLPTRSTDRR